MSADGYGWVVERGLAAAAPTAGPMHLALVEIANFATLRRALGIHRADLLMLDLAERIAALVPAASVATVGRNLVELMLANPCADAAGVAVAAITAGFAEPMVVDGTPHRIRLLIGTASAGASGPDDIRLLEDAEQALARLRQTQLPDMSPRGTYRPGDDARASNELRGAIAAGELFLHYQPKLHLRRQKIVSLEALIRWHHPRRGLVLPSDFIPLAERTGAIGALTLWTLRQVIADQRLLVRNGHDLPVFVNMAGALLSENAFVDEVIALIAPSGARIGIEITETSVIGDPDGAIHNLQRLADIDVAITIDDYGAGLSSLAYLKKLPASELKIDKLFVTQLTSSHRDPLIVRSTIDLAHALEMEVVAEGVETPASLALLTVMGCDMVQGYLISRPLALEALYAFLREERHLALAVNSPSPLQRMAAVRARG